MDGPRPDPAGTVQGGAAQATSHDLDGLEEFARDLPCGLALVSTGGELRPLNRAAEGRLAAATPEERERLLDLAREQAGRPATPSIVELTAPVEEPTVTLRVVGLPQAWGGGLLAEVDSPAHRAGTQENLVLASRLRSLHNLYRSILHELQAPLQALGLNLELLRESLEEETTGTGVDGERLEYVGLLRTELLRLERMVRSFLSQAAPPSGQPEELELKRLVREVVQLVQPQARSLGQHIEVLLPSRPVPVHGRADQVKQVVLTLLQNAFEAMGRGGTVRITLELREAEARLSIADEGRGIPEELLGRVFDLHVSTKATGEGIGLTVARSLIRAHGGTLTLSNRVPPPGAVAEIRLPLSPHGGTTWSTP